ncbi:HAMP domain-containing sensor histidine kinase [uncultured Clostridium sp.]|uniref:sensor histidine kinase n=1 Tax=uncultured Clostridium sp. TaxID=59620 RepID=UPI0026206215|nr:HAMP domain-containing sensor histidine kinase [uncultured Clostridium sp.]
MDIKLKNSIKKYFKTLWLIEIILLIVVSVINVEVMIGYIGSSASQNGTGPLNAIVNRSGFYESLLESDAKVISQEVYSRTNSLSDLLTNSPEKISAIRKMIYNGNFYNEQPPEVGINAGNIDSIPNNIFFIIRDKANGRVYSNDPFLQGTDTLSEKEMYDAISEKYRGQKVIIYTCNNTNLYNKSVQEGLVTYSTKILKNFVEVYYTPQSTFSSAVNDAIDDIIFFGVSLAINIVLILKLIIVFANSKGNIEISGNFVGDIIYIWKYAFKYKGPRRALITTIILSIIFYIIYLYLLAIGGTQNNIIAKFFGSYPFKGSFLLVLMPMIGIMYSIKRNIEIGMVKDSLKIINDGNFEHTVKEIGGVEIRELIRNINKMKNGYNIAVEEALYNEKLKTELISNVSHDLKTPLTSIINYVNILQDKGLSEKERTEYLKILETKSSKLKRLIEDLFEVSKINSGKITLDKIKIDITALIYQVIGEYSSLYEEKNIEFKVECAEDEITIDLDGIMISRVIENIVINSLKYSMENTRVYVSIIKEDNGVLISFKNVANYEMDFDEDQMFERFARADKSRNSTIEGSGLGLAITKSIVELHNGTTRIKRDGDVFKIYVFLPFADETDEFINKINEKKVLKEIKKEEE